MAEGTNEYKLIQEIIDLSESKNYFQAFQEWDLIEVYNIDAKHDDPLTCLCGHYPIYEICHIQNKLNGNKAIVGNVCINKFFETDADFIFKCVKRLKQDISKSMNQSMLDYALKKGYTLHWEYTFYCKRIHKRNLNEAEVRLKIKINTKVLKQMQLQAKKYIEQYKREKENRNKTVLE